MVFLWFETYTSFKRASKQNWFYKLGTDDKVLSSLIRKTWRTCFFKSLQGSK